VTPYQRGAAFERRVQQLLERQGWRVIRSAGSHSPVDLVAWPPPGSVLWALHRTWVVQAKRGRRLAPGEQDALREWADACQAEAVWVYPAAGSRGLVFRVWLEHAWHPVDLAAESGRVGR